MPLGASEQKLRKSLLPNEKGARIKKRRRARHSATKEATP
jgi:hypothetical protein